MASNGNRRPPRPRIELVSGGASAGEAAAIVAALERFLAETAPAPAPQDGGSRWQRAALIEGVSSRNPAGQGWGPAPR